MMRRWTWDDPRRSERVDRWGERLLLLTLAGIGFCVGVVIVASFALFAVLAGIVELSPYP